MLPVTRLLHGAANCLESNYRALAQPEANALHIDSGNVVNAKSCEELHTELQKATDCGSPSSVTLLRSLAEACRRQEAHLESEKQRIEKELSEAYVGIQGDGESEYKLFGIWVHQGQDARSGHYLAFIKDWKAKDEDRWMRFSDSFVSFVSWEEVRSAAIGSGEARSGTASSAYVLVYMEASLAAQAGTHQELELISTLYEEIEADNKVLQNERGSWEEQVKARELRQHAQGIFQDYAGLLHRWEPQKQQGDAGGNPHEPSHRKMLNDPVPMP